MTVVSWLHLLLTQYLQELACTALAASAREYFYTDCHRCSLAMKDAQLPCLPLPPRRSVPSRRGSPKFDASVNRRPRPRPRSLKRTYLKSRAVVIHSALSNGQITEWEWERGEKGREPIHQPDEISTKRALSRRRRGRRLLSLQLKAATAPLPIFAYLLFESPSLILAAASLGLVRDLCACIKGRSGARAVTRRSP